MMTLAFLGLKTLEPLNKVSTVQVVTYLVGLLLEYINSGLQDLISGNLRELDQEGRSHNTQQVIRHNH